MMFNCKLCLKSHYSATEYLCNECDKIRILMEVYDRRKVINILEKCLIINQFKIDTDTEDLEDGRAKAYP
mgnify:CR=1 FL=1